MKKNGKKILALLCAVSILLPCFTFSAAAEEASDAKTEKYVRESAVINGLGYFDAAKSHKPEGLVSGPDFSLVFENMTGRNVDALYIGLPQLAQVKFADAVKVFLDAMGYKAMAELGGGYPVGYLNQGIKTKLLKGLKAEAGEALTWDVYAKLIYNAMEIPMVYTTALYEGQEKIHTQKDITFMSELLKLGKIKGRLTGAQGAGIYTGTQEREAIIDGVKYSLETKADISSLIGMYVEAYYSTENDEERIVYAVADERYEGLTINAKDVVSYSDRTVTYETETGREDTISFSADADIIKNGALLAGYSKDDFVFEYGTLTFVDGKSGDCDTVIITQYKDFVVSGIHESDRTLYNSIAATEADKTLVLDEKLKREITITDANGSALEFSNIQAGDVLSVAESSAAVKIIRCQERKNSFYISGVEQTEEGVYLHSGDVSIKLSRDYLRHTNGVAPKQMNSVNLYLNSFGDAAYLSVGLSEDYMLGYLLRTGLGKGLEQGLKVKMLLTTNAFATLECADSLVIEEANGVSKKYKDAVEAYNKIGTYKGVISYRLNEDGKIAEILFPLEPSADGSRRPDRLYHYIPEAGCSYIFKAQIASLGNRLFFDNGYSQIFALPQNPEEDDRYYVIGTGHMNADSGYAGAFEAYTFGANELSVRAMAVKGFDDGFSKSDDYFVVKSVVSAIMNDTPGKKVSGFQNGNAISYFAPYLEDGKTALDVATSRPNNAKKIQVEEGDIIRVNCDRRTGEVKMAEILFDRDEVNPAFPDGQLGNLAQCIGLYNPSAYNSNPWGMYITGQSVYPGAYDVTSAHCRTIYAWVLKKTGSYITITTQDLSLGEYEPGKEGFITETHSIGRFGTMGMTINYSDKGKISVKGLSLDYVRDYESVGTECSRVIVRTNQGVPSSWYTLNND